MQPSFNLLKVFSSTDRPERQPVPCICNWLRDTQASGDWFSVAVSQRVSGGDLAVRRGLGYFIFPFVGTLLLIYIYLYIYVYMYTYVYGYMYM